MNCPFHVLIYQSQQRSYRELPLRFGELGGVYRYEQSGVVHGILRARGFTQDDSHTFCTEDQIQEELRLHIDFVLTWLRDFGFDEFEADLSTRPEKAILDEEHRWDVAEKALADALDASGVDYQVASGEGAFYGPKIDVHIKDAIGRRWQCSTIQLDVNTPRRFGLEYVDSTNSPETPYMIHCAKAGSLERFMGILVEHYAGAFPMWLAPVQVSIIPVADRHEEYARQVKGRLRDAGLRAEVDLSTETVGDKIRKALTQKHPAVIVVGDNDVANGTVGLRLYGEDRDTRGVPLIEVTNQLVEMAQAPVTDDGPKVDREGIHIDRQLAERDLHRGGARLQHRGRVPVSIPDATTRRRLGLSGGRRPVLLRLPGWLDRGDRVRRSWPSGISLSAWPLAIDEHTAMTTAAAVVDFPIGHASASVRFQDGGPALDGPSSCTPPPSHQIAGASSWLMPCPGRSSKPPTSRTSPRSERSALVDRLEYRGWRARCRPAGAGRSATTSRLPAPSIAPAIRGAAPWRRAP